MELTQRESLVPPGPAPTISRFRALRYSCSNAPWRGAVAKLQKGQMDRQNGMWMEIPRGSDAFGIGLPHPTGETVGKHYLQPALSSPEHRDLESLVNLRQLRIGLAR